jgi:hypothetical protein
MENNGFAISQAALILPNFNRMFSKEIKKRQIGDLGMT